MTSKYLPHSSPALLSRRTALATIGAVACGVSFAAAAPPLRKKIPVGVQLWTLRREAAEDLAGTLKQVAKIGYQGVELWFQKWPAAKELQAILQDCGLKVSSAHVNLTDLLADFPRLVAYHQEIGNNTLVVPFINNFQKLTTDDWLKRIEEIRQVARLANEAGVRMLYHNHAFEFQVKVGEKELHDAIFDAIDPKLLQAEIDLFFVADVGKSPAEMLKKFSGRVKMVHLKEKSKPGDKYVNAELGRGVIDWPSVFPAAEAAGVEWYLVEQNCEDRPALESIRVSYEYLREQGVVG
jgi:sugar phosphate isomerase/epimerase